MALIHQVPTDFPDAKVSEAGGIPALSEAVVVKGAWESSAFD